jgi:hypothetical protein
MCCLLSIGAAGHSAFTQHLLRVDEAAATACLHALQKRHLLPCGAVDTVRLTRNRIDDRTAWWAAARTRRSPAPPPRTPRVHTARTRPSCTEQQYRRRCHRCRHRAWHSTMRAHTSRRCVRLGVGAADRSPRCLPQWLRIRTSKTQANPRQSPNLRAGRGSQSDLYVCMYVLFALVPILQALYIRFYYTVAPQSWAGRCRAAVAATPPPRAALRCRRTAP